MSILLLNIQIETLLLVIPIMIATISLVLQYISHRNSVLDSVFERERKLGEVLDSGRKYEIRNITSKRITIRLEFGKVRIIESSGVFRKISKYINPFGDLKGHSFVLFGLTQMSGFPQGAYKISGLPAESSIAEGIVVKTPSSQMSILALEINSVDVHKTSYKISELWDYRQDIDFVNFRKLDSEKRRQIMGKFF